MLFAAKISDFCCLAKHNGIIFVNRSGPHPFKTLRNPVIFTRIPSKNKIICTINLILLYLQPVMLPFFYVNG